MMNRQIVTLFWRELRHELDEEGRKQYREDEARLTRLASSQPGFISAKSYEAEDGEHLTVVLFDSESEQEGWRRHSEHSAAQARGRARYYQWYRSLVCRVERDRLWTVEEA